MTIMTALRLAALPALLLAAGTAPAQEGGRPFTTTLTGAAKVPGPGDPDGGGTAKVRVNAGQRQVCYDLTVTAIATATLAHIHRGSRTVAGPAVVTLAPPASGSSKGCVTVTRALAQEIIRNPAGFYVNVHNAAFGDGAVRGQLSRSSTN